MCSQVMGLFNLYSTLEKPMDLESLTPALENIQTLLKDRPAASAQQVNDLNEKH